MKKIIVILICTLLIATIAPSMMGNKIEQETTTSKTNEMCGTSKEEIYCSDFEDPYDIYNNWQTVDGGGEPPDTWTLKYSGYTHYFHCTQFDVYLPSQLDYLVLNMGGSGLDISGYNEVELCFDHWCEGEYAWDVGYVEISFDGFITPGIQISPNYYKTVEWEEECITIDTEGEDALFIRWVWQSDPSIGYRGWYIDNPCIYGESEQSYRDWSKPEIDDLPDTIAIKVLNIPILGQKEIQVVIRGPTSVDRKEPKRNPDGRWQIETEIISMDLTGHILGMPIQIRESPEKHSTGIIRQITPGEDFPAESFFDVYVEIQTPLPRPFNIIYNKEPVIMSNIIDYIPPYLDNYTSNNTPVPLYTKTGIFSTRPIGYIVNASHLLPPKPSELEVEITRPKEGRLYLLDIELMSLQRTIVGGPITIEAESDTTLDKVRFYINGKLKNTDSSPPYSWTWNENPVYLQNLIQAIAYDNSGNIAGDSIVVVKLL